MKLEISSDRGRVGPLVWYNQQPIRYFTWDSDQDGYVWTPQIVREGHGYCYLDFGAVSIDLHLNDMFSDFWSMVKSWFGRGDD